MSVDGETGSITFNSGGGSGGLLYVNASSLFGRGSLTSHGGNGLSGSSSGQSYGKLEGIGVMLGVGGRERWQWWFTVRQRLLPVLTRQFNK